MRIKELRKSRQVYGTKQQGSQSSSVSFADTFPFLLMKGEGFQSILNLAFPYREALGEGVTSLSRRDG